MVTVSIITSSCSGSLFLAWWFCVCLAAYALNHKYFIKIKELFLKSLSREKLLEICPEDHSTGAYFLIHILSS